MPLIRWDDSFTVGVPACDADHQVLIDLINQLEEAQSDGCAHDVIGSVLNALLDYTETHFVREEGILNRLGYPMLPDHHREHEKFTAWVTDLGLRYGHGEIPVVGQTVLLYLRDWLTRHILGSDKAYSPFVAGKDTDIEDLAMFSLDDLPEMEKEAADDIWDAIGAAGETRQ